MRTALAHAVSIAGHPAILMPVAAGLSAMERGAPPALILGVLIVTGGFAAAAGLYSFVQVWRGRWVDTDASLPKERRELNLLLAGLLAGGALWAWLDGRLFALVAGLGLAAVLVAAALLSSRWLKVSLHMAFAVLAVSLFWPDAGLVLPGLAAAGVIAWSRLHLKRHTPREVAAGAAAGLIAGCVFVVLV